MKKSKCQTCGKDLISKSSPKRYCDSCKKIINDKKNKLRFIVKEKYKIGTCDISPHLSLDRYGKPNWENEQRIIDYVKKKIFYYGNCIKFHRGFYDAHGYDKRNNFVY